MPVSITPGRPPARRIAPPLPDALPQARPTLPLEPPTLTPIRDLPLTAALAHLASSYAAALVECWTGHRPLAQLAPSMSPESFAACAGLGSALEGEPRLRSVRAQRPAPLSLELCLHLTDRRGSHAIALRLERVGGRWRCDQFEASVPLNGAARAA